MKAKDLKLRVVNENEKGEIEIKEFKPYMNYESFIGCIVPKAEILRPTGLKDKNLNEICEGNIVKIHEKFYSIEYEIGSFMLIRCSDKTDMYKEFENCWNDDVYPLSQLYWENNCEEDTIYELEIIGNIYENKDLLEQR